MTVAFQSIDCGKVRIEIIVKRQWCYSVFLVHF